MTSAITLNHGNFSPVQLLMVLLLAVSGANAEYSDRLKLSAGGYDIFRYDSSMSLSETNFGIGVTFTPEDSLGWKNEQTVFRFDGRYRFTPAHSLAVSWYAIDASGNRGLKDENRLARYQRRRHHDSDWSRCPLEP